LLLFGSRTCQVLFYHPTADIFHSPLLCLVHAGSLNGSVCAQLEPIRQQCKLMAYKPVKYMSRVKRIQIITNSHTLYHHIFTLNTRVFRLPFAYTYMTTATSHIKASTWAWNNSMCVLANAIMSHEALLKITFNSNERPTLPPTTDHSLLAFTPPCPCLGVHLLQW